MQYPLCPHGTIVILIYFSVKHTLHIPTPLTGTSATRGELLTIENLYGEMSGGDISFFCDLLDVPYSWIDWLQGLLRSNLSF